MIARAAYLDASAFVKTVSVEPQTEALVRFLRDWPQRISSTLLRTEATRAARAFDAARVERTLALLETVELLGIEDHILRDAGMIDPARVRTLDAIHLATAHAARDEIGVLVTYDRRMIEGAGLLGLATASPS